MDRFVKTTNFLESLLGTAHEDADGKGAFEKVGSFEAKVDQGDQGQVAGLFGVGDGPSGKDVGWLAVELVGEAFDEIVGQLGVGVGEEKVLAAGGLGAQIALVGNVADGGDDLLKLG